MSKVCSLCHKSFREGVDCPQGYLLKVDMPPYTYWECFDCAKAVGDPRVMTLRAPAIIGKSQPVLRKAPPRIYRCLKCGNRITEDLLAPPPYDVEPLCKTCHGELRARRRDRNDHENIDSRPVPTVLGASIHKLLDRQNELLKEQARLRSSGPQLILRDQIKLENHTRNDAMAKTLRPHAGFFDAGALQDHQRLRKRAEAIEAQSRRPQPRAFFSLDALAKAQKNSRTPDGLSSSTSGDGTSGAEQVAITDRAMPRSYGAQPSQRDDSFIDILPGGPANPAPAADPYRDSTSLHPEWVPGGDATPVTLADANQRDTGGIRLFNGDSSAYLKLSTPADRFIGSNLVVRSPSRAQADVAKFAMDLAMKLRRGPKFFGRNL